MAEVIPSLLFPIIGNTYSADEVTQIRIKLDKPNIQKIQLELVIKCYYNSRLLDSVRQKIVQSIKIDYDINDPNKNRNVQFDPETSILLYNIDYPTTKFVKGNFYEIQVTYGTITRITDLENDIVESENLNNFTEEYDFNYSINIGPYFTIFCNNKKTKIPNIEKIFYHPITEFIQAINELGEEGGTGGTGDNGEYSNITLQNDILPAYLAKLDELPDCIDFTLNKEPSGDEGKDLGYTITTVDDKEIINISTNSNIIQTKGPYIFIDLTKLPEIKEHTLYNLFFDSGSIKSENDISIEEVEDLQFIIPITDLNPIEEEPEESSEENTEDDETPETENS